MSGIQFSQPDRLIQVELIFEDYPESNYRNVMTIAEFIKVWGHIGFLKVWAKDLRDGCDEKLSYFNEKEAYQLNLSTIIDSKECPVPKGYTITGRLNNVKAAVHDGTVNVKKAWEIQFPECSEIRFMVHHLVEDYPDDDSPSDYWTVSEVSTGRAFIPIAKTKAEAIGRARQRLQSFEKDYILNHLDKIPKINHFI